MSIRDSKIILSTKKENTADFLEEIFNEPAEIKYKYKGEIRSILIDRLSLISIEKASRAFIKLIKIYNEAKKTDGLTMYSYAEILVDHFSKPEEFSDVKNILFSCTNITPEEFSKFPPSFALKIINEWVEVNQNEIGEFSKRFLALKGMMTQIKGTLFPIPQAKE